MHAIVCTRCGSKIAATRQRCPKCRAHIIKVDASAEAARSRRLATGSAIFFGACMLVLGLLWLTTDSTPGGTVNAEARDPLATRRPSAPTAPTAAVDLEKQKAFFEPSHGATSSYRSGDFASALAQFEAAVAKNPGDAESVSNLGQVLVKLGRAADAVPLFERACTLNPTRWAYRFNLARALAALERWDESIESYRKAQQLFPADYVTTFNLALTLHKKGDEGAAVEEYKKAVELNPEEPSFRMALGISYEALRQSQNAATAYGEYLKLAPTAADAGRVRAKIVQLREQTGPGAGASPGLP